MLFQVKYKWVTWTKFLLKCKETNLYWQLPSFSSKVTWIEMLEDTNPVPHVELLDISQRKCAFLSNTVMWYLMLLIIDISPMEFDYICFTFPCRLTFVHVALFCFLTHQFIGFWKDDYEINNLNVNTTLQTKQLQRFMPQCICCKPS